MAEEHKTLEAGEYTLVAKLYKAAYRGVLWREGKILFQIEGESLDDAFRKLLSLLYEEQLTKAAKRNGLSPSTEEATKALYRIWPKISAGQKAMLLAHHKAKDQRITATQLAQAAGYASYSAANLQYGLLGGLLFAEMPEELPRRGDGTPIMTCAIARGDASEKDAEDDWVWKMRPHIYDALCLLNQGGGGTLRHLLHCLRAGSVFEQRLATT